MILRTCRCSPPESGVGGGDNDRRCACVYMCVCLPASLSLCLSPCLPVSLSPCLPVPLSLSLCSPPLCVHQRNPSPLLLLDTSATKTHLHDGVSPVKRPVAPKPQVVNLFYPRRWAVAFKGKLALVILHLHVGSSACRHSSCLMQQQGARAWGWPRGALHPSKHTGQAEVKRKHENKHRVITHTHTHTHHTNRHS